MPRPASLRAISAAALLALALPTAAAEVTRVASSGDEDNPFDLDFTVRMGLIRDKATISREYAFEPSTGAPLATVEERPELAYSRFTAAIEPRLAIGIYKDLEFHVEVPIILSSTTRWSYANSAEGVKQTDATSSTGMNGIDANGDACAAPPCPIFAGSGTVYHGSDIGDVKLGLAWGILSDVRDETKPFWLLGVDFTYPTATMYDPAKGRTGPAFTSPYSEPGKTGAFGEGVLKIDFVTALSKRMGQIDPYVRFHATSYRQITDAYSNCNHAAELTAAYTVANPGAPKQMADVADTACVGTAAAQWGAKPPWIGGAAFGAEVVTGENKTDGTRVAVDVRLSADYVSRARWYNELTDATGKILTTEEHFVIDAYFGFYWRASKNMQVQASARLGSETPHFITGEETGGIDGTTGKAKNPNYDYRYDAAGTRYRLTSVANFGVAIAGVVQF
jgi:hypothetical protein